MEPRGPRDAAVFTDDFEIESFIDSVLEVRESAVAGRRRGGIRLNAVCCPRPPCGVGGVFVSLGMMPHFVDIGPSLMSKVRPFHRVPPWCGRCI